MYWTNLLASRLLSDIVEDADLDGEHIRAVQRKHKGAVQRETETVTFNGAIDYGSTIVYSAVHSTLPALVVATSAGTMKSGSAMADHYTSDTSEVMRARIKAHAPTLVSRSPKATFHFARHSLPRESARQLYRTKRAHDW